MDDLTSFKAAGRTLFSLGLVKGTEGNLSAFDGATLVITRTGAPLDRLAEKDVISGELNEALSGASSDLDVHRAMYVERGAGAIVHAHPPGTMPEGGGGPGRHGLYVFGPSLKEAAEEAVRQARELQRGRRVMTNEIRSVEWTGASLRMLDQRRLPYEETYVEATSAGEVADAIRTMAVRGAPLLGITAGFGTALAGASSAAGEAAGVVRDMEAAGRLLIESRPTAVNIAWAVERVVLVSRAATEEGPDAIRAAALSEAMAIAAEDRRSCDAIGRFGAELVPDEADILTHCNTGALATGGSGTAMAVIVAAHNAGKRIHVWVDETRPVLQGARLTAWELQRLDVPMTLVADSVAASLMARRRVDLVVVGADRIASNGDVANKVGTYQLAIAARFHSVPFYVAAPFSTFDPGTASGADIEIEERDPAEVTAPLGVRFAPQGTPSHNPAFDVTPASLVTAIVTDRGVVRPPIAASLQLKREQDALVRS
jgi:methylthioribose-1-phosphate isomerase